MAHMYPVGGPTKPTPSPAEREVYDILQHALDDDYYVLHSVRWNNTEPGKRIREGEVDFVIVHPGRGIILFEVKGGQVIACDGPTKQWTSTDAAGVVRTIKDPFAQVADSAHHVREKIRRRPATRPYMKEYYLNSAVWFPGITWEPGKYALHVDDNVVLDSSALKEPANAISRLFAHVHQQPVSPDALKALIKVLAPTESTKARLRDAFNREDAVFIQLQESQYRTLDMMKHHPRVTVRGAAGTGKTVIALERARQFAVDGMDVLFVCSNLSLARWLQSMIAEEPDEIKLQIEIHHVEELCAQVIKQAGLALPNQNATQREEIGNRIEQIDLSSPFLRSINKLEQEGRLTKYDAILVDEGQDIDRPLWQPLYKLLRDKHNGKFIACFDPAQREREGEDLWFPPVPNGSRELPLAVNCRNTQEIFKTAQQFYRGLEVPTCAGPAGRSVEWIDAEAALPSDTTPEELIVAALEKALDRLVVKEGISPRDVIVVTCGSQKTSTLFKRATVGKHLLSSKMDERDPQCVRMVTIRSVKGLESPVIIIAEVEKLAKMRVDNPELYSRFMYIATSRAKNHLIVLNSAAETLPLQPALSTTLL